MREEILPYGSGTFSVATRKRNAALKASGFAVVLSAALVALVFIASSETSNQPVSELLGSAEQLSEAKALQQQYVKQAQADVTRAKEINSLLQTANFDLQSDEAEANKYAVKAQKQAQLLASLQQKSGVTLGNQKMGLAAQLSTSEEQDAMQQNLLLQQEASLKQQEQQLLLGESEESNLAAEAEQQAQQFHLAANKDQALIKGELTAIAGDKKEIQALMMKENPIQQNIEKLQNQINTDRVAMQMAMNKVDQLEEDNQEKQLQAELDARSKRRQDRDNAERELNIAVAKEQSLQNGPDHRRLKLKGAAAARLLAAQNAVKKAQAKLAAAYSETYTPLPSLSVSPSPAYAAAQKAEDAATAKVENDMSLQKGLKQSLGLIETRIENYQNHETSNERLVQMIENRAGSEEADVALTNGRAASARQTAAQDAKQISYLQALALGVQKRIQYFSQKRNSVLGQLTSHEMGAKKVAQKVQSVQSELSATAAEQSSLQSKAAAAYAKVAQQAKQIEALKAEEQEDSSLASRLFAKAAAEGRYASSTLNQAVAMQQK